MTRREFLYYIWAASMALFLAETGGAIVWFAIPRFKAGEFGGVFDLDIAEVPPVNSGPVAYDAGRFWLVNNGDKELQHQYTYNGDELKVDYPAAAGREGALQGVRAPGLPVQVGADQRPLRVPLPRLEVPAHRHAGGRAGPAQPGRVRGPGAGRQRQGSSDETKAGGGQPRRAGGRISPARSSCASTPASASSAKTIPRPTAANRYRAAQEHHMAVFKPHIPILDDIKTKGFLPAMLFKTNEAVERLTAGSGHRRYPRRAARRPAAAAQPARQAARRRLLVPHAAHLLPQPGHRAVPVVPAGLAVDLLLRLRDPHRPDPDGVLHARRRWWPTRTCSTSWATCPSAA